jgi:hypothetical protein
VPRIKPIRPKSKLRNKKSIMGLRSRIKPSNFYKKGVRRMTPVNFNKQYEVDDDNVNLDCMDNIRNRAKAAMGGKRLSKQEARKILELIKYEK